MFQSETGDEELGVEEEHVELFTTPTTKMGAATSDFGYNLFRALAGSEASTNVFLSPISVSAALTQLSLGEDTNTQLTKPKLVPPRCVQPETQPTDNPVIRWSEGSHDQTPLSL